MTQQFSEYLRMWIHQIEIYFLDNWMRILIPLAIVFFWRILIKINSDQNYSLKGYQKLYSKKFIFRSIVICYISYTLQLFLKEYESNTYFITDYLFINDTEFQVTDKFLYNFVIFFSWWFIWVLLYYLFKSKKTYYTFNNDNKNSNNHFKVLLQYFKHASKFIVILCLANYLIYYSVLFTKSHFHDQQKYLFDWIIKENIDYTQAYSKGYFFSTYVSLPFAVYLFYALINRFNIISNWVQATILSVICFFSISLAVYMFACLYYQLINAPFVETLRIAFKDNVITLQVSTIVAFYSISKFYIKRILFKRIFTDVHGENRMFSQNPVLRYQDYSSAYLAQLGFYVVLIYILWFFTRTQVHEIFSFILNYSLFYIIDDWQIIHEYSSKYGHVLANHSKKIKIFNGILVLSCLAAFINVKDFLSLIAFAIVLGILLLFRYNNKAIITEDEMEGV